MKRNPWTSQKNTTEQKAQSFHRYEAVIMEEELLLIGGGLFWFHNN